MDLDFSSCFKDLHLNDQFLRINIFSLHSPNMFVCGLQSEKLLHATEMPLSSHMFLFSLTGVRGPISKTKFQKTYAADSLCLTSYQVLVLAPAALFTALCQNQKISCLLSNRLRCLGLTFILGIKEKHLQEISGCFWTIFTRKPKYLLCKPSFILQKSDCC